MMVSLPEHFPDRQWVCLTCGYNMIGEMPDICPFCGARHEHFRSWEDGEAQFRVTPIAVTDTVTQLLSRPRLGLEHAAYRIETPEAALWIDSPSAFNRDLAPVQDIYFTHRDFLGASNQYRALWGASVHLHAADAADANVAAFPVDDPFEDDFRNGAIEAFHIGGHSPGFTVYRFGDVFFACDYAYPPGLSMHLNPYGDREATVTGGRSLLTLVADFRPAVVCGFNYVADGREWLEDFERAMRRAA